MRGCLRLEWKNQGWRGGQGFGYIGIDIGMVKWPSRLCEGDAGTGLWRCGHQCGHGNGDGQRKILKNNHGRSENQH